VSITQTKIQTAGYQTRAIRTGKIHITYVGNFLSRHGLNPTYSEALVPKLCEQGITVRRASSFLNPVMRFLDMGAAVWNAPRNNSCVILDLCSGPRAFPAADVISRICRATRKPYVVVLHGGTLPKLLTNSRTRLLKILKGATRVVSPSKYLADTFAPHVTVEVIPNALNIVNYPFRLRLSPRPNFLYLRALHTGYGALVAIKAFAIVQRKYPAARLVMAGPALDDAEAKCKELAQQLRIEAFVEFPGRVPKSRIPELGEQCDIFLNPTFVDNTPVSVVEAMAMGMCVVATNVGGLPYLLEDGETALLVPPRNDQAMAEAMLRILEDPKLAERLSCNARSAAKGMDWGAITPRWLKLIRGVTQ
jgi:glycosyltransferase involved in cell wall biosynthesis